MFTIVSEYYGTGEGVTMMVLFTRRQDALQAFSDRFGGFYVMGAEVFEGLVFDFPYADVLVSERVRQMLEQLNNEAGGLEYYASMHFNLS